MSSATEFTIISETIYVFIALTVFYPKIYLLQTVSILAIAYPYYFFVKPPFASIMSSGGPTSTILPPSKTLKYRITEMHGGDDLTTAPFDSQNLSPVSLPLISQSHHPPLSCLHLGPLQFSSTSLGRGLPGSSAGCCEVTMRQGKTAKMSVLDFWHGCKTKYQD